MKFKKLIAAIAFATSVCAHAHYTVTIYQSGSDVIAVGSGSINMISLKGDVYTRVIQPNIASGYGLLALGKRNPGIYLGQVTGPDRFGFAPGVIDATYAEGDAVGIDASWGTLMVPNGYVSGAPLQSLARWNDWTLSSLGLRPGEYRWSWGEGTYWDTFTIVVTQEENPFPTTPVTIEELLRKGIDGVCKQCDEDNTPGYLDNLRGFGVRHTN